MYNQATTLNRPTIKKTLSLRGVCLVFEPAYDAHIPKDVVQAPIEIAKLLGGCPVYLITRPNRFQSQLSSYFNVVYLGPPIPQNDEALVNRQEDKMVWSFKWYEEACRVAAQYADILMLFPHNADATKGARIFRVANLLKGRRSAVYLKLDATPETLEKQPSPGTSIKARIQLFKRWLKHLPIAAISAESLQTLQAFNRLYPELKNKSFLVKNCPPQSEVFRLDAQIPVANKQPIFLTVGRLGSFQKATEVLLSAWILAARCCPEWKLLLVGACEQDFQQNWMKKLQEAGIDNTVEWAGVINDREVLWNIYHQVSIFVLPSRYEGASLVLGEAIRAGCALIATPVGEVPSLLDSSHPGVMPIDDVEALAKAMILFASDEALRNQQVTQLVAKIQDRQWPEQLTSVSQKLRSCVLGK